MVFHKKKDCSGKRRRRNQIVIMTKPILKRHIMKMIKIWLLQLNKGDKMTKNQEESWNLTKLQLQRAQNHRNNSILEIKREL
mmetsp:Transcript_49285/g.154615  ORF Transcript_49285/g.154615 Transcript_49285/m.154615 type:complete len:82 (-) Transcript_49285:1141-1386(-)